MTDETIPKQKHKFTHLQGLDPKKPFFLGIIPDNSDDSFGVEGEAIECAFTSKQKTIVALRDVCEEFEGMYGYVFKCVPVAYVGRGKVRVTKP